MVFLHKDGTFEVIEADEARPDDGAVDIVGAGVVTSNIRTGTVEIS